MNDARRYVRSPEVVTRRIGGELVLVPLGSPEGSAVGTAPGFVVLNETAEELWDQLAGPVTEPELARHLIETFEVDPARASADAGQFIREMLLLGAISAMEG